MKRNKSCFNRYQKQTEINTKSNGNLRKGEKIKKYKNQNKSCGNYIKKTQKSKKINKYQDLEDTPFPTEEVTRKSG